MANLLRCQRIGCNATFTEDDNPEDSCTYHESIVILMLTKKTCIVSSMKLSWSTLLAIDCTILGLAQTCLVLVLIQFINEYM
ncbi:putative CHORD domain-containing protein [Helianthus annuus]|nr:putative CHORD domain-containing protein [Helianthus annuus]